MSSTVNLFISRSPKKTSNSQLDDKALWQSVRKGNDLAFSNLYQRFSNLLFNYGMHFCYNRELVKDCIQELFTTIWNRREALSEIDSVKYYLFKSFRNLLVQHISNDRKRFVDFNDSYEFEESDFSIESSIIIEEYLNENKQKIATALFKISKRQREIVILKYFNDLSYAEISSLMDLTPASAHNLLSKALQCLRVVIKIFLIATFFMSL